MAQESVARAYFSLVRWRDDVTRDEARNVAVILVDAEGQFGGVRVAPVSSVSRGLRDQGLLDAMMRGLAEQFERPEKPDLSRLREMQATMTHSLCLTEPQPTAVPDVDVTLQALYKAYVAPRGGGGKSFAKGVILDRVVQGLRGRGWTVARGTYVSDFQFDAIVETPEQRAALGVLSFASGARDLAPVERDAGHFLYALERTHLTGTAVIQRPTVDAPAQAEESYERVLRWCHVANVPISDPETVVDPQAKLALV